MKAVLENFALVVKDGRFTFKSETQKAMFVSFLRQHEGKKVWVTVDSRIPKRSDRQNRYYWLYLNVIARETGQPAVDIHEWAKSKFLKKGRKRVFGEEIMTVGSTTDLNKNDFTEYIMSIEEATEIKSPDASIFDLAPPKDK